MDANADSSRDKEGMLLVYVNGSHEYVIFDPRNSEEVVVSKNTHKKFQAEEHGEYYMVCFIVLECVIFIVFHWLHIRLFCTIPVTCNCYRFVLNKQNIVGMLYQYVSLLYAVFSRSCPCEKNDVSPISFQLYKVVEPLVCCFSTNRLRFYLWRASKTGVKERVRRCSIHPFRQALGDHIQWIVSCPSTSHKTMLRILVIIVGEETCWK